MKDWNLVVTSAAGGMKERLLLRELRQLGEFAPAGFRSVYLGRAEDVGKFLGDLREATELMPEAFAALGHVVPIDETHSFEPGEFREAARQAVLPLAERIGPRRFIVRAKRRGYKGVLSSLEVERELAELLLAELERAGFEPKDNIAKIDFEDPDVILAVEIFPNRFGLSLISREMKARYPFIKVK
jgi:tRNA(Ser,Leu) C12 N-acetylase TAN1